MLLILNRRKIFSRIYPNIQSLQITLKSNHDVDWQCRNFRLVIILSQAPNFRDDKKKITKKKSKKKITKKKTKIYIPRYINNYLTVHIFLL